MNSSVAFACFILALAVVGSVARVDPSTFVSDEIPAGFTGPIEPKKTGQRGDGVEIQPQTVPAPTPAVVTVPPPAEEVAVAPAAEPVVPAGPAESPDDLADTVDVVAPQPQAGAPGAPSGGFGAAGTPGAPAAKVIRVEG